ncbi:tRNA (adenosine(37)-N6)-threonylcarbamoyltransferase complex dimerization subunit type 1 TsaB [Edaphobacter albus]|uniref:tRNA (adenosine(37)-N6)-threonylcarbamoyltransferase complex dimerization subunit type 1 TsaB n=1 Tax=Edaphobacter sp. 4G125 TaxID=2763071 RepID=UPI001645F830|nr:tRNA (adenosine(37)-N6)-threonylcarbamoyltransferase complex dimerization subunit type 1 TsaB [Edaphobacter sp. 4G125]QNI35892.1 tRNA (adenosine(37)-N6)-threonylcarbamoyltransferase complex dimerization subunit type 1 TsaB [Edaphobacter sp. 4G125]
MMRLLLIDTCGGEGSVALAEGESPKVVASEVLPGRSASERLIPAIRQEMEDKGWRLSDLMAIVVVHGPGSFTGVRVGLSAAKGLCEAGRIPLIAVSRLALIANAVGKMEGEVCAVLDAGRGEFYCGVYAGQRKISESLLTAEEVARAAEGVSALVSCEPKVVEVLSALGPHLVGEPKADDALPFALEKIAREEFDDPATIDANYLRRTDLEIFAKVAKGASR